MEGLKAIREYILVLKYAKKHGKAEGYQLRKAGILAQSSAYERIKQLKEKEYLNESGCITESGKKYLNVHRISILPHQVKKPIITVPIKLNESNTMQIARVIEGVGTVEIITSHQGSFTITSTIPESNLYVVEQKGTPVYFLPETPTLGTVT